MQKTSIIGAGAFGTALAKHLSQNNEVKIWSYEAKVVEEINKLHQNLTFLPSVSLNSQTTATTNLAEAFAFSAYIVNATPVFAVRETYKNAPLKNKILINSSKGIEKGSHQLLHEVFAATVSQEFTYAVMSGPSFATEVGEGLETFVTLACKGKKELALLKTLFTSKTFKVETTDDIIGVELGGALKNVLAIATGLASGSGLGKNFQAALFNKGLAEMASLGIKMGAKKETFYNLSGLGDLFLTSTSDQSRNFNFGFRLGQGETLESASEGKTVEGVGSAESAFYLVEKHGVESVIFKTIYDIIFQKEDPKLSIKKMWSDM